MIDHYELALGVVGLVALFAAWVPTHLVSRPMSLPLALVGLGAGLFLLPLGFDSPDPRQQVDMAERLTELVVIISLMGVGLSIDRPLGWRRWSTTWRMLGIAMPVTIALTATLGATIGGLGAVGGLLLGAVLAPTDPVLATDVQVGEPSLENDAEAPSEGAEEEEDEVRFTLTSEGGLNDALAFPFVYAAIRVVDAGWDPGGWLVIWLAWDLIGRVVIGLAVGWAVGRLLGAIAFRAPGRFSSLAETRQGFVAIAATFLAYGVGEVLQGYGFLAVFVAAVVLRSIERDHAFHGELHAFTEEAENLVMVGLLLLFGGSLVTGVLAALDWNGAICAVVLLFVIRPLSGHLAMVGSSVRPLDRTVIAFFGIRGFGSIYYLSYALGEADFPHTDELWAIVSLTLLISIAVHGITASPAMGMVDHVVRRARRGPRRAGRERPPSP